MEAQAVLAALAALRLPPGVGEDEMHRHIAQGLARAGLPCVHEAKLAPRCRIDFLVGDVGVEVKCGKPGRAALLSQLARYAACPQVMALVLVVQRSVRLPPQVGGKPCHTVGMNRLWGIALP
ncbi:MAG: hypothetical protein LBU67_10690 [Oscillospiraceae bacterium]|jgi:hypothetical protein|nr:hypothetical protein [Oscillospiraceae bacterium]